MREGEWTPVAAVRTAAVAEVAIFGIEARRVVDFALGSLSQRAYRGLAFHRRDGAPVIHSAVSARLSANYAQHLLKVMADVETQSPFWTVASSLPSIHRTERLTMCPAPKCIFDSLNTIKAAQPLCTA